MYWPGYSQPAYNPFVYPSYAQPQYYPSYMQPAYHYPVKPQLSMPTVFNSFQPQYAPQQSLYGVTSRIVQPTRQMPLRQSNYFSTPIQPPQQQVRYLQSPLRQSVGPNQLLYGSPQRMPLIQSPVKKPPQFQPQVRQGTNKGPTQQQQLQYLPSPLPQPLTQPQLQPQRQQQSKPQPQSQQKEDDLDKRFAEAIDRTKKIVEKYSLGDKNEPTQKPQENQRQQPQQASNNYEMPKDQETPNDENQEDLALQYEDGYIYRGQGIPPQTRQGFGVLTDADNNEVYAGFWKDNLYDGDGRLTNLQQESLDGPLDWNNMTSIGNGWATYEGQFSGGKMHGKGELLLTNGEKYKGEFVDGMVHGEGEFTTFDSNLVRGVWESGFLVQLIE